MHWTAGSRLCYTLNLTGPPPVMSIVMQPDDLLWPVAFHKDHAYFLERSEKRAGSCLGGPLGRSVRGIKHGPMPLHHIATLNGDCVEPLWQVIGGGTLPLLYGMCFDACILKYSYTATNIELLEMKPKRSASEWPYSDYARYLPYFPLRLGRKVQCSLEEFSEVSCQQLDVAPSVLVVIVPPSTVLGMSLWGPSGDGEGTQIVFHCDISKRIVSAYNQCG